MALTKRITKGSPLTFLEGDDNLDYLYSLSTNTGSFVVSSQTSSFVVSSQTGSFIVNGQSESFKFTGSLNFTGSVDITGSTKANSVLLNGGGLASNWIYPINIENINWRDPAVLTSDRPGFTHFYPSNTNFGVGSDNDFTYYFGDVNFGHRMKSSVAGVLKFSRDFSAVPDTKMYTLVSDGSNVSDNNTSIFGYNNFNGKTHILTVSGSFRSVDNTSLGSNINNTHHITGSTFISGSIAQIGSLSIGLSNSATGDFSHAEGELTNAVSRASHAEGYFTQANNSYSHAEGEGSIANGQASHAEGFSTIAGGQASHAEGRSTNSSGPFSHAEGYLTTASGDYSHAEGFSTVAAGNYQHVQGQFNQISSAVSAFIIGNGTSSLNRSNLVFASGSTFQITGSLNVTGSIVVTGSLSFQSSTGSTIFLPNISGSFTTSSLSNLTGSGVPFLHVINGELWFYNGSIFEKLNS